jgi:hypothetical protein
MAGGTCAGLIEPHEFGPLRVPGLHPVVQRQHVL